MSILSLVQRSKRMVSEKNYLRNKFLELSKILLMVLLTFGNSIEGRAQTEFSEQQYQMFRSFYYDSLNTILELIGNDGRQTIFRRL